MQFSFSSLSRPKRVAKSLRVLLQTAAEETERAALPLSGCQDIVAELFGYANWHELEKSVGRSNPTPDDDQVDAIARNERLQQYTAVVQRRLPYLAPYATELVRRLAPSGNRIEKDHRNNIDVSGSGVLGEIIPLKHPKARMAFALKRNSQSAQIWVIAVSGTHLLVSSFTEADLNVCVSALIDEKEPCYLNIGGALRLLGYAAHGSAGAWLRDESASSDDEARSRLAQVREQLEGHCHRQALAIITDTQCRFKSWHYDFYAEAGSLGDHRRRFAKSFPWASAMVVEGSLEGQGVTSTIDLGYDPLSGLDAWLKRHIPVTRAAVVQERLDRYYWPIGEFRWRAILKVLDRLKSAEVPRSQVEVDAFVQFSDLLARACMDNSNFDADLVLRIARQMPHASWCDRLNLLVVEGEKLFYACDGFRPRMQPGTRETAIEKAEWSFSLMRHLVCDFRAYTQPACLATRNNLCRVLLNGRRNRMFFRDFIPEAELDTTAALFFGRGGLAELCACLKAWHDHFGQGEDWVAFSKLNVQEQLDRFRPMLPQSSDEWTPEGVHDFVVAQLAQRGYGLDDLTDHQIQELIVQQDWDNDIEALFGELTS